RRVRPPPRRAGLLRRTSPPRADKGPPRRQPLPAAAGASAAQGHLPVRPPASGRRTRARQRAHVPDLRRPGPGMGIRPQGQGRRCVPHRSALQLGHRPLRADVRVLPPPVWPRRRARAGGGVMTRYLRVAGLSAVLLAAAILSFSALRDLAIAVRIDERLAFLLPIAVDAGAAVSCTVWLS